MAVAVAGAALGTLATLAVTRRTRAALPVAPARRTPSPRHVTLPVPLESVLEHLRELIGAERVVLWNVDRGADLVVPVASTVPPPRPLLAAGDPLCWSAEQGQPLRLDPRPSWAIAEVLAVPIDATGHARVVTVEGEGVEPVIEKPLAAILGSILDHRDRRAQSLADLVRFHRILDFLRDLPRSRDPGAFPADLARTAAEVAGCAGALVARCDDFESGRRTGAAHGVAGGPGGVVLARHGDDDGPRPGDTFGADDGALTMAARSAATIRREAGADAGGLTGRADRWTRRPRCSATTPLLDPEGHCTGILALWGDEPIDQHAVELFEALGPLLAIQLHHFADLARFRDRVERDGLTGLADRGALEERLELETRRFHGYRRPVALLLLDLDHFKEINDTYGHPAGDAVLRRLADLLRANTREPDLAARYGGEEMVVVLPDAMLREAEEVAERIRDAVETAAIEHEGNPLPVTVSIGVSSCPESADDPRALIPSADAALYEAKRGGRNSVATAPPIPSRG
jgi:diguanylate cyclase (GGDEF)-like protein